MDRDHSVKSYEDASDYSIQLNRWFLKPVGAWPSSDSTTVREKMISKILIVICYSLVAFTVIPCILYIVLEDIDVEQRIQAVGPLSHWFLGGIDYFSLLFRSREIYHCIQHMRSDWRTVTKIEDRQVMMKYAKVGRFVAGMCAVFMHCGIITYSVVQAFTPTFVNVGNVSILVHVLPVPTYSKFIDITQSPTGDIALTLQLMAALVANSARVGACSLAAVFAMHASGQLNVLTRLLDQLDEDQKQHDAVQHRLAIIVEHHLRVLSFVARMEALLNQICFVELLGCTFNLCMVGYYIIMGWNVIEKEKSISYMIIYLSVCFNIFIFCFIGEVVIQQCEQVGETAYMTNWYHLPHKPARGLILIISRSSNVIKLTAGKLVNLSIATFADVMKTSMVYLNMLRTMSERS